MISLTADAHLPILATKKLTAHFTTALTRTLMTNFTKLATTILAAHFTTLTTRTLMTYITTLATILGHVYMGRDKQRNMLQCDMVRDNSVYMVLHTTPAYDQCLSGLYSQYSSGKPPPQSVSRGKCDSARGSRASVRHMRERVNAPDIDVSILWRVCCASVTLSCLLCPVETYINDDDTFNNIGNGNFATHFTTLAIRILMTTFHNIVNENNWQRGHWRHILQRKNWHILQHWQREHWWQILKKWHREYWRHSSHHWQRKY